MFAWGGVSAEMFAGEGVSAEMFAGGVSADPGCPLPSVALQVQNHGLKHQSYHLYRQKCLLEEEEDLWLGVEEEYTMFVVPIDGPERWRM